MGLSHRVVPRRRARSTQSMLPDTANQALKSIGIEQTKVGGGDKERAYIVKQNAMLKVGLTVFFVLAIFGSVLCFTVLDVKVQRRGTVMARLHMRQEQHRGHTDIIKKNLKLQNVLLEEKNDVDMIRDARATVGSLLASYHDDVMKALVTNKKAQKEVEKHNKNSAKFLKKIIDDLFKQAKKEQKSADIAMEQVGASIGIEEKEDEAEEHAFKDDMTAMGEDADELAAETPEPDAEDGVVPPDETGAGETDETAAQEDVETNLQRFFKKADAAAAEYKHLEDDALEKIKAFRDEAATRMGESEDMEKFNKTKLEADADALLTQHGLKKWSESKKIFPEVTDYIDDIVDHKGYRQHKAEIEALREGMRGGTMTANTVVAELEKIDASNPASHIPLHWMWAEEADVGFEEDEAYMASITPEEEAEAELDNEAHEDMPLNDPALPADGDVEASTGSVPPGLDTDLATIPPPSTDTTEKTDTSATVLPNEGGEDKPANLATIPPPAGPTNEKKDEAAKVGEKVEGLSA